MGAPISTSCVSPVARGCPGGSVPTSKPERQTDSNASSPLRARGAHTRRQLCCWQPCRKSLPLGRDDLKTRGGPRERKAPQTCPSPAECSSRPPHLAAPPDPPPALRTQGPSSCSACNQDPPLTAFLPSLRVFPPITCLGERSPGGSGIQEQVFITRAVTAGY